MTMMGETSAGGNNFSQRQVDERRLPRRARRDVRGQIGMGLARSIAGLRLARCGKDCVRKATRAVSEFCGEAVADQG